MARIGFQRSVRETGLVCNLLSDDSCMGHLGARYNSLRFFFVGFVKSKVFESPMNDLVDLEKRIKAVIKGISKNCWRML